MLNAWHIPYMTESGPINSPVSKRHLFRFRRINSITSLYAYDRSLTEELTVNESIQCMQPVWNMTRQSQRAFKTNGNFRHRQIDSFWEDNGFSSCISRELSKLQRFFFFFNTSVFHVLILVMNESRVFNRTSPGTNLLRI